MAILGNFIKQPAEVIDYDVDFTDWLAGIDTLVSATATVAPEGLALQTPIISTTRVKVWCSGGTDGQSYKITVTATTAEGRVKQDEFRIRIKDY